jgi:TolA-binding protein
MLDLIRLRVARGEGLQLVSQLEAMASGKDPRLPRDAALFQLAEIWNHEGKRDEAGRLLRKLVEDFPDSPYRLEAQQQLSAGG